MRAFVMLLVKDNLLAYLLYYDTERRAVSLLCDWFLSEYRRCSMQADAASCGAFAWFMVEFHWAQHSSSSSRIAVDNVSQLSVTRALSISSTLHVPCVIHLKQLTHKPASHTHVMTSADIPLFLNFRNNAPIPSSRHNLSYELWWLSGG